MIRLDDRVAIVTGAGGGLGRSHALALASRGASIVVNDLGGSLDGAGASSSAADKVVEEITTAGGKAVANHASVATAEGASEIFQTAVQSFGRLDIVVNNAGILRDTSFKKMTLDDWNAVIAVHLTGSMNVTKAAWEHFRENNYGRVVNTSSAAGLYGNFGQANYSSAKMALVAFTKTLAQEGKKNNIKANVVAPIAASRMTETILPPEILAKLDPAFVSSLVTYLSSESCESSGDVFAVGGGYVSKVDIVEGTGVVFSSDEGQDPDAIAKRWGDVTNMNGARPFATAMDAIQNALGKLT